MTKDAEEGESNNAVSILNMLGQLVHQTPKYSTEKSQTQVKKHKNEPTEFICTATFGTATAEGTDTSKKAAKHIAGVNLLEAAKRVYGTLEEARQNKLDVKKANMGSTEKFWKLTKF